MTTNHGDWGALQCGDPAPRRPAVSVVDVLHGRDDDVRSLLADLATCREAMLYTQDCLGKLPAFGDEIGPNVSKAQLATAHEKLSRALAAVRS